MRLGLTRFLLGSVLFSATTLFGIVYAVWGSVTADYFYSIK